MELSEFGLKPWASIVFVRVYEKSSLVGYVFVINRKEFRKFSRKFPQWKIPGGTRDDERDKNSLDTARWELYEETGLLLPLDSFRWRGKQLGLKLDHWRHLFTVNVSLSDVSKLNSNVPGNQGEEPKFFTIDEFHRLVQEGGFLEDHYRVLKSYDLISSLVLG